MYSMTPSKNGKGITLEENTGKPRLLIGSKVFTFGAGMSESEGVVIGEPDQHGAQKCVTVSEYENRFFIIDRYSRPISKKFGIGVYYDDQTNEFFDQDTINDMIMRATDADRKRDEEANAEKQAYAKAKIDVVGVYPYLTPLTSSYDKKATKANLVALLKHMFAGIYFSIRNDHGYSYIITWENGPTRDEVKDQTDKFRNIYFDGMTDSEVYYDNAFADVFGSLDYISLKRTWCKDIEVMWEGNKHLMGNGDRDWFNDAFNRQSFPAGAKITGFDDDNNVFNYTTPEPQAETITAGDIEITDYSEKAIVVRGNTKPIKDDLKALGGRFNFRLQGGAGWIFPKREEARIRQALSM